ncbi:MAG: flagellin lysine-N-methylase [Selenomonadaceae bacterium]|nr:flagellin lysine-N-methylase [Selenomonadaceae bacterium]
MKCIEPSYVKKFRCDGKICGARCCRDWRIIVDEDTYDKYSALKNPARDEIFRHTDWVEDEITNVDIMVIKLRKDGVCSFLDESDCLCSLQKKHGEEFLTAICQSFPRVTYQLDENFFEQSMTLTCPLAANLILMSNAPITFTESEKVTARAIIGFKKKITRPVEDFINLQMQAIQILQDRNFSINQRLKNLCEIFAELPPAEFDFKRHCETLTEIFIQTYGVELAQDKKLELLQNYSFNREKILAQVYEKFSNILENYLVNEFFMRCYPCAYSGGDFHNIKIFVTAFRLLEFALVLTAIAKKNVSLEEIIRLIYSVNDMIDHSQGGMEEIIDFAKNCSVENFVRQMLGV